MQVTSWEHFSPYLGVPDVILGGTPCHPGLEKMLPVDIIPGAIMAQSHQKVAQRNSSASSCLVAVTTHSWLTTLAGELTCKCYSVTTAFKASFLSFSLHCAVLFCFTYFFLDWFVSSLQSEWKLFFFQSAALSRSVSSWATGKSILRTGDFLMSRDWNRNQVSVVEGQEFPNRFLGAWKTFLSLKRAII